MANCPVPGGTGQPVVEKYAGFRGLSLDSAGGNALDDVAL